MRDDGHHNQAMSRTGCPAGSLEVSQVMTDLSKLPRRVPGATVPDSERGRAAPIHYVGRAMVDQTGRTFANDEVAVARLRAALGDWEPSHV
jgi:hypothetical protein